MATTVSRRKPPPPVLATQPWTPTASDDPMGSPAKAGPPAGPPTGLSPTPTASDDPMGSLAKAGSPEGLPTGNKALIIPFRPRDEAPLPRARVVVDDAEVLEEDEPEGIRAGLRAANFPPTVDIRSQFFCIVC